MSFTQDDNIRFTIRLADNQRTLILHAERIDQSPDERLHHEQHLGMIQIDMAQSPSQVIVFAMQHMQEELRKGRGGVGLTP